MRYIKAKSVKAKAKELGKRTSKSFLAALDMMVEIKIENAVRTLRSKFKTLKREDLL